MKRIIMLLAAMILIASCEEKKQKHEIIEEAEKAGLSTGQLTDTVFLNIAFGMKKEAVIKEVEAHKKDGILVKDKKGYYYFEYALPGVNDELFHVYQDYWFDGDTLVKAALYFSPTVLYDLPQLYRYDISGQMMMRYGIDVYFDGEEYVFVRNNLKLTVGVRVGAVECIYEDLRYNEKKKEIEASENKELSKKSSRLF